MKKNSIIKRLKNINWKKAFSRKYYCKTCGACISDQRDFKDNAGKSWICGKCGTTIYGKDLKNKMTHMEDLMHGNGDFTWLCECCGTVLNSQEDFEEDCKVWTCVKCGYLNHINYEERKAKEERMERLLEEAEKENRRRNWKRTILGETEEQVQEEQFQEEKVQEEQPAKPEQSSEGIQTTEKASMGEAAAGETANDKGSQPAKPEQDKKETAKSEPSKEPDPGLLLKGFRGIRQFIKKTWKILLIFGLVIGGTSYLASNLRELGNIKKADINFVDTVGKPYQEILAHFSEAGFINVITEKMEDLTEENMEQDKQVYEVTIDGTINFSEKSRYKKDVPVIIRYHSPQKIRIILPSEKIEGMNYVNVKERLEEVGFQNIKTEAIYDLKMGFLTKDGEIEDISIDGQTEFDENAKFAPEDEIVIRYHTFEKKKGQKGKD